MTIKEARKAVGLTQQGLSDWLKIPMRTIQDWEAGKRHCPPWCQRLAIEKILHYKGNGKIPYFMVEEYEVNPKTGIIADGGGEMLWYSGFDFDDAMNAYNAADVAFEKSSKHDRERTRIEAQLYFLPADIDVTDEDAITNELRSSAYNDFMPPIG